jgi:hypothetical protein
VGTKEAGNCEKVNTIYPPPPCELMRVFLCAFIETIHVCHDPSSRLSYASILFGFVFANWISHFIRDCVASCIRTTGLG